MAAGSQPTMRRLAPQRKKKPAVSASDANASNQNHLPINISDGDDENMILCTDYDDEHSNNETEDNEGIAMKNVADWTTLEQPQDTDNKQETVSIDNSSEEEEEEEEEEEGEKEYHGEIESITSSTPDSNKLDTESTSNDDADNTYEKEEQEIFKIPTENTISLNPPPPTNPLVLVSLEELCGCSPETQEEKLLLVSDLMDSLLGSTKDADNNEEDEDKGDKEEKDTENKSNQLGDGLSLDFDERITELFDSNVASHVDSSYPIAISCLEDDTDTKEEGKEKVVTPYAIIPYPEFLSDEITNPTTLNTTTSVRSTIRLWKLLYTLPITTDEQPRISSLLSKIFSHLRNTSRSLLWKADMYTNLCHLSKSEYKHQIKRQQLQEYNIWKTSGRSERLEKLYEVRDTFVLQVDVAKKRYNLLVEEREGRVDRELRRRGLFGEVKDAVDNVEGSTSLVDDVKRDGYDEQDEYDDDGWGGTICEDDILGEETNISRKFIDATVQEDEEFENDEWAPVETGINPLGMNIAVDGPVVASSTNNESSESQGKKIKQANKNKVTNKLEPISHDDNIKRKSDRKQRKQDKTSRTEYLKREQESISETLKTNDERIAEATLLKLEEKLQKVEDLLESLQEEEWEAEEEEGHSSSTFEDEKDQGVGNNESTEGSLLDRILAMILGGLPREKDSEGNDIKTEKEHYIYIGEEHKSIVKEWIEVFGRLPQTFPSSELPEPQHEVWPDDTFGDEVIPSETMFLENKGSNDIKLIGNEHGNWDD